MAHRKKCSTCGSTDLRFDAWAEWDEARQEYVLSETFDSTVWCAECEGETSVAEEEIGGENGEENAYKTRIDLALHPAYDGLKHDTDGRPCVWRNAYRCSECGEEWEDEWSCQCNDRCPDCNAEIEPLDSEWIGPRDEALADLWEELPET